jgi:hypothetical protein
MLFKHGAMCLPLVTVDNKDGLNASPEKMTMGSGLPDAAAADLMFLISVTKRAAPPTGSRSLGSTLYLFNLLQKIIASR